MGTTVDVSNFRFPKHQLTISIYRRCVNNVELRFVLLVCVVGVNCVVCCTLSTRG